MLARSYNPLAYHEQLKKTLIAFYCDESLYTFSKYDLHKKVNNDLLAFYHGEEVLKFRLANYHRDKECVAAFEVNAFNSRADFLAINGTTRCFEIKSKIDTLSRLKKQSTDYKYLFEYNTIVVDEKHIDQTNAIIPDYYGIWSFKGNQRIVYRKALISPELNPTKQLNILTKKELKNQFFITEINEIQNSFSPNDINSKFKIILKKRYNERWSFLLKYWNLILPIDLQFFFNRNIDPKIIYS